MSSFAKKAKFCPLITVPTASITGTYLAVGDPFMAPICAIYIVNDTNGDVVVSFDGVTDHLYVRNNQFHNYDISIVNGASGGICFPIGTQIYVKDGLISGTIGQFNVSTLTAV